MTHSSSGGEYASYPGDDVEEAFNRFASSARAICEHKNYSSNDVASALNHSWSQHTTNIDSKIPAKAVNLLRRLKRAYPGFNPTLTESRSNAMSSDNTFFGSKGMKPSPHLHDQPNDMSEIAGKDPRKRSTKNQIGTPTVGKGSMERAGTVKSGGPKNEGRLKSLNANILKENAEKLAKRIKNALRETAHGIRGRHLVNFTVMVTEGNEKNRTMIRRRLAEAIADVEEVLQFHSVDDVMLEAWFKDSYGAIVMKKDIPLGFVAPRGPIVSEGKAIFRFRRNAEIFSESLGNAGYVCRVMPHNWGAAVSAPVTMETANRAFRSINEAWYDPRTWFGGKKQAPAPQAAQIQPSMRDFNRPMVNPRKPGISDFHHASDAPEVRTKDGKPLSNAEAAELTRMHQSQDALASEYARIEQGDPNRHNPYAGRRAPVSAATPTNQIAAKNQPPFQGKLRKALSYKLPELANKAQSAMAQARQLIRQLQENMRRRRNLVEWGDEQRLAVPDDGDYNIDPPMPTQPNQRTELDDLTTRMTSGPQSLSQGAVKGLGGSLLSQMSKVLMPDEIGYNQQHEKALTAIFQNAIKQVRGSITSLGQHLKNAQRDNQGNKYQMATMDKEGNVPMPEFGTRNTPGGDALGRRINQRSMGARRASDDFVTKQGPTRDYASGYKIENRRRNRISINESIEAVKSLMGEFEMMIDQLRDSINHVTGKKTRRNERRAGADSGDVEVQRSKAIQNAPGRRLNNYAGVDPKTGMQVKRQNAQMKGPQVNDPFLDIDNERLTFGKKKR